MPCAVRTEVRVQGVSGADASARRASTFRTRPVARRNLIAAEQRIVPRPDHMAPRRSGTHCCRSTQSRWGSFSLGNSHVELPHISGILIVHTPGRVRFCVTVLRRTSRRPMREESLPILSCARVRRSCSRWPLPYLASKFGSVFVLPSSRKPRMLKEKPVRAPIPPPKTAWNPVLK